MERAVASFVCLNLILYKKVPTLPLYLCAPTASGKTRLAISLAKSLNGEIVNADAYQLYAGIEPLTASPTLEEQQEVPHHLYSVLSAQQNCNAMEYRRMALPVIKDIMCRGKMPIIVGGSGMYIKFLTHGPSPVPSSQPELRRELEEKSDAQLIAHLQKLDPQGANQTNLTNRRYVIRALEICLLSGQKMSELKADWKQQNQIREQKLCGLYLLWEREALRSRIYQRSKTIFTPPVIEKIQQIAPSLSLTASKAIGISHILDYCQGSINHATLLDNCSTATSRYAKRQRTWFSKEKWLTPLICPTTPSKGINAVKKRILEFSQSPIEQEAVWHTKEGE